MSTEDNKSAGNICLENCSDQQDESENNCLNLRFKNSQDTNESSKQNNNNNNNRDKKNKKQNSKKENIKKFELSSRPNYENIESSNGSQQASQKNNSQQQKNSRLLGNYQIGKTLGEGTFGKVKQGTHILTNEKVAIKILEKDKIVDVADVERVSREIHILKLLRHPSIVQLYEIIETPKQLFLVMEYAENGELFDYIVQQTRVKEREAARFLQQIINGIEYIHELKIVHRDLKPENLLLAGKKTLKIVDFGLSNTYKTGELLKTACGSPCYAAPEMIAGKKYNGITVDIWSCGVILYALICGYLPFEDQNTSNLYSKILAGDYQIPDFISEDAQDLIKKILTVDPEQRYTIEQIRQHPWYQLSNANIPSQGIVVGKNSIPIDQDIIKLCIEAGYEEDYILKCLEANKHNEVTTTYYLLLKKHITLGGTSKADINSANFDTNLLNQKKRFARSSKSYHTTQIHSEDIENSQFKNKNQKFLEEMKDSNNSNNNKIRVPQLNSQRATQFIQQGQFTTIRKKVDGLPSINGQQHQQQNQILTQRQRGISYNGYENQLFKEQSATNQLDELYDIKNNQNKQMDMSYQRKMKVMMYNTRSPSPPKLDGSGNNNSKFQKQNLKILQSSLQNPAPYLMNPYFQKNNYYTSKNQKQIQSSNVSSIQSRKQSIVRPPRGGGVGEQKYVRTNVKKLRSESYNTGDGSRLDNYQQDKQNKFNNPHQLQNSVGTKQNSSKQQQQSRVNGITRLRNNTQSFDQDPILQKFSDQKAQNLLPFQQKKLMSQERQRIKQQYSGRQRENQQNLAINGQSQYDQQKFLKEIIA